MNPTASFGSRTPVITVICAALVGMLRSSVLAQSRQFELPAFPQTVAAAEPQSGSNPVSGAATILKTPVAAPEPIPQGIAQPSAIGAPPAPPSSVDSISRMAPTVATGSQSATPATGSTTNLASSTATALGMQVQALGQFFPGDAVQRRIYERAASLFPNFCHDWEQLLHEREVNNLQHLSWRQQGGMEAANYTGYGKLESCECKASKEGLPIGKIRYEEINYSLLGKTIEEAIRTAPRLSGQVETLEIFSWDKGKWFY